MNELEKKEKIETIRAQAKDIIQYISNIMIYCEEISCFECPMNIHLEKDDICCLHNIELRRRIR